MTDPTKKADPPKAAPPKDPPKADPPKDEPKAEEQEPDDPRHIADAEVLVEKAKARPINPATGKKYKKGEIPAGWNQPCE